MSPNSEKPSDESEQSKAAANAIDPRVIMKQALRNVSSERQKAEDGARLVFSRSVDIVDDPSIAPRLAARHEQARITDDLVRSLLLYINDHDLHARQHVDETIRVDAARNGFFLEKYDVALMHSRITERYPSGTRRFIIAETSVKDAMDHSIPCADAQFRIPDIADDAGRALELPTDSDPKMNHGLIGQLRDMPHAFASLDDVVCQPEYKRTKSASAAMRAGFHAIATVENPLRGNKKIRFITACLASIQGIVLSNGVEWRLQEDGGITPIFNERSAEIFEHMRTDLCERLRTAFVLHDRRIELTGIEGASALIVDWHTKIGELKE